MVFDAGVSAIRSAILSASSRLDVGVATPPPSIGVVWVSIRGLLVEDSRKPG
jgi:hypothetical protein